VFLLDKYKNFTRSQTFREKLPYFSVSNHVTDYTFLASAYT